MSVSTQIDESTIRSVVESVLSQLNGGSINVQSAAASVKPNSSKNGKSCGCGCQKGVYGVFQDAAKAAAAASDAFEQLKAKGFAGRAKVIEIVKSMCAAKAQEWGRLELDETKIGRLEHKIEKLESIRGMPGVEWLRPMGFSGDRGISMEENAPWGVIGVITPVTHSIPTIACNIVNMVAAGNALVVNPHPGGAKCATVAVRAFNQAIAKEIGIENLVSIIETPSLESFDALCKSEEVSMLCITGGPGVVKAAMASGKRSVCAGPGNPPVVVDETADLDKAAADVIFGGGYDNNLLCIGEKQVFVVDAVYSKFLTAMERAGAARLSHQQVEALADHAFTMKGDGGGCSKPVLNRELVGADASKLAQIAGVKVDPKTMMLFGETDADHLFVEEEQMMPFMPIIRSRDVNEAIAAAKKSEHGYRHSAMIHSLNVVNMTKMAREMDTTLFVKNGPCLAGLGSGGEGYGSFSVATTTGEGITTPKTFTRFRRCVMVDNLSIL